MCQYVTHATETLAYCSDQCLEMETADKADELCVPPTVMFAWCSSSQASSVELQAGVTVADTILWVSTVNMSTPGHIIFFIISFQDLDK